MKNNEIQTYNLFIEELNQTQIKSLNQKKSQNQNQNPSTPFTKIRIQNSNIILFYKHENPNAHPLNLIKHENNQTPEFLFTKYSQSFRSAPRFYGFEEPNEREKMVAMVAIC